MPLPDAVVLAASLRMQPHRRELLSNLGPVSCSEFGQEDYRRSDIAVNKEEYHDFSYVAVTLLKRENFVRLTPCAFMQW